MQSTNKSTRTVETTPQQRTAARLAAGVNPGNNSYPVRVIPGGGLAPRLLGHDYYWTTPSGKTIVHYPNAYRWPTVYHCSTRRVVVGEKWLAENAR